MRFKLLLLVSCVTWVVIPMNAQRKSTLYKFDIGGHLSMSNYLGDLGGKDGVGRTKAPWDMNLNQTRWATGVFGRYKLNDLISFHLSTNYTRIQSADNLSTNRGRRGRNLSFRNDIFDFAARTEMYVYNIPDIGYTGKYRWDFKSYVFLGVGAFVHNPKAYYEGAWVDLRSLKTEGQSKEYAKVGFTMPVGFGFFFTKKRKYRIGWEASWRLTFTDYLDDVSTTYADPTTLSNATAVSLANRHNEVAGNPDVPSSIYYEAGQKRGDSNENDTYFYTGFTFSYVICRNTFYTQNYNWIGERTRVRVKIKF